MFASILITDVEYSSYTECNVPDWACVSICFQYESYFRNFLYIYKIAKKQKTDILTLSNHHLG